MAGDAFALDVDCTLTEHARYLPYPFAHSPTGLLSHATLLCVFATASGMHKLTAGAGTADHSIAYVRQQPAMLQLEA